MKRANAVIATEIEATPGGTLVRFTVKDAGVITLEMARLNSAIIDHAAVHGMVQRISDAAAISRDPKNGQAATPEEKFEAMQKLVEYYHSGTGEWSRVREAGPKGGFLFEALVKMYPDKTPEAVRAWLDTLDDKQQAALREDDAVAPIIAGIKAARNADKPKMDTKAILAGLQ